MRITFISDTHTQHKKLDGFLPGGDILIHSGDFMSSGYNSQELSDFCSWLNDKSQYDSMIFIAGNHDRYIENLPEKAMEIISSYKWIDYLQDEEISILKGSGEDEEIVRIYGSPWQPEFYNWAFNLPRGGKKLEEVWDKIPEGVDILVTHGPPQGHLDTSGPPYNEPLLGCELLTKRIEVVKPKIHVFGHIHGGAGYKFDGTTHYINASMLDERYIFRNKPITVDWDPKTNTLEFLNP